MGNFSNLSLLFIVIGIFGCKSAESHKSELEGLNQKDASAVPQYVRFEIPLSNLEKSILGATDVNDAARKFVNGPARVAAYQIQALGRIYQDQDKWFKNLRSEFQEIENTIGEYDKWNNIISNGPKTLADPEKKILEGKRDAALKGVESLLVKNLWFGASKSRGAVLRQELSQIDWKSPDKDRTLVLTHIADELKEMRDTTYQFKNLEKGKGLHELRRDMKWVLIEMRVLNGLVLKDLAVCPSLKYSPLPSAPIAKSKYSDLPASVLEKDPCLIPECLFLGIVQAVDDIGRLKDEAEIRLSTSGGDKDKVPDDIRLKAEGFYNELVVGKLFSLTHDAVKTCLK